MKQPTDRSHAPALSDAHIGKEAGVSGTDHQAIRLWLRLLACSTQIEQQISQRLRTRFGTTLARFDYMAQLNRYPEGLRMKVLSRYLMVTGGSVTGLTDQLVSEGFVTREEDPDDRRALVVRLTPAGVQQFEKMAAEHEEWLNTMFAGLGQPEQEELYRLLGHMRSVLAEG
ncbi:MarR family winged helix-turn-helix transcriptional regulator [Hydrogenophaga crassostreae]|nr:MarR family transcriptional regulator [Hydrogenophaga crassostreae]